MKFSVFAGDGGSMRMATRITFENDEGEVATISGGIGASTSRRSEVGRSGN